MRVGETVVRVDRIGDRAVIGYGGNSAVLPSWDAFLSQDCDRGDVAAFGDPPADDE